MTTIHHTPPPGATPFAIYEDPEDLEPPSPSDVYEGDTSFNSEASLPGADEAIPSIENEQEFEEGPAPYKSSYTSRSSILSNAQSRRVSGVTTTSFISSLPSEISIASKPILPASHAVDSKYTPRKDRPAFRNPSSVRAMQMSSPPPFNAFESPRDRVKGAYKLATPSRSGRSETPVSATRSKRSGSHRESHHREPHAEVQQSPRPPPTPQQHLPLVLLHVTILPMQIPYSHDLMIKVMPEWLVENYRVLAEKLEDIVLMRRGLLIPHPREEYDVLEETILESLELKTPRLLKCGHFVPPEGDTEGQDDSEEEESGSVTDDGTGRGSRMSGGTITVEEEGEWKDQAAEYDNASLCTDCHRQVKRPGKGVGSGTKRWDIKIYAANGLMRAGAWSAAWREMERCDVEISPWIPEEVRKAMERRVEEEQEVERQRLLHEAEVQHRIEEEAVRLKKLEIEAEEKRRLEETEMRKKIEAEEAEKQRRAEEEAEAKRRVEDALNERIEEAKETMRLEFEAQALAESGSVAERFRLLEEKLKSAEANAAAQRPPVSDLPAFERHARHQSRGRLRSTSRRPPTNEIPLSTLLRNYILVLARDQKNIAIVILSAFVVFLAMHMSPSQHMQLPSSMHSELPDDQLSSSVSQLVVTTTATMTATSFSTTIVTQTEHYSMDMSQPGSSPEATVRAVDSTSSVDETASSTVSTSALGEAASISASQDEPSKPSEASPSPDHRSPSSTIEDSPSTSPTTDPSTPTSNSALPIAESDSDSKLTLEDLDS